LNRSILAGALKDLSGLIAIFDGIKRENVV